MTHTKEKTNYLALELAPKIQGLRFRLFQRAQDFEEMARIDKAANEADGVKEAISAQNFAYYYTYAENADADQDILFAEINGEIVGFGQTSWDDEMEGTRVYFLSGMVDPTWRRKGLGRAMMTYNERRLRKIASGHPDVKEKALHGWVVEPSIGGNMLFKQQGYEAIRYFYRMICDLSKPIAVPKYPPNVELRPVKRKQFRQIYDAMEEAFQDHWGLAKSSEARYERWAKNPLWDEALWKVAWEGDEVAGMVLNMINADENEKLGENWGWTDTICVRRPWRKRGLAKALILDSLNMLKEMDFAHAALDVDTENSTGALDLYESTGFKILEKTNDYRKAME